MRLMLFLVAALPALAHDWLIVPGHRVGPISANSTEASLRDAFGRTAVAQATIRIDGTTAPGLEVYHGRPGESLAVVWPRMERGLWWPLVVIPCYESAGAECRWRTAGGVRVGISVGELEKLNAKPFLLYPSPERHFWSEPWWDDGALAGQLGEDVELYFDDPGYEFSNGEPYMRTDGKPLASRGLRVSRLLVFLLSGQRAAPVNDWILVPGERFGPIPTGAAAEPLRETLGPAKVHRTLAYGDEGMGPFPAISVFGGQAGREVRLSEYGSVICGGPGGYNKCEWHIAGGIPWTTTVAAMEKLNGRPFVFNGCCFDEGGLVRSWEGGRLEKRPLPRLAVSCDGEQPDRLSGDSVQVRSDDPDIRRLPCTVEVVDF